MQIKNEENSEFDDVMTIVYRLNNFFGKKSACLVIEYQSNFLAIDLQDCQNFLDVFNKVLEDAKNKIKK